MYSTMESVVVVREDTSSFLCAMEEGKRQICSNKSCEGVTFTRSGGKNARVWLVDTAG